MTFFTLLEGQADAACKAAEEFYTLGRSFADAEACIQRLDQIEHDADQLTHQFMNKVDSTFVTPLDKEDLHALSTVLDNVTDDIEGAASRILLYHISEPHPDLEVMLGVLVRATQAMRRAVGGLRDMRRRDQLQADLVAVHDLEHEVDALFRKAVSGLFSGPDPDPLYVMKWKEMFDRIEQAVNACENVADVLESIVIKYA
jgi:predicted phosphate transport protein (TIGR00153 family)